MLLRFSILATLLLVALAENIENLDDLLAEECSTRDELIRDGQVDTRGSPPLCAANPCSNNSVTVVTEDDCAKSLHCNFSDGKCFTKILLNVEVIDADDFSAGMSLLFASSTSSGGTSTGDDDDDDEIQRRFLSTGPGGGLPPGLNLACMNPFPTSCGPLDFADALAPPVNIPYCLRVPCSAQNPLLEEQRWECHKIPGCYFDLELANMRRRVGQSIMPGVPVCHLAIRNKDFQQRASQKIMPDGVTPMTGVYSKCLIKEHPLEVNPGCYMLSAMRYAHMQPKNAGWPGITAEECLYIDGCPLEQGCYHPAELNQVKVRSGTDEHRRAIPTPADIYGQPMCQPLEMNSGPGAFLDSYHSCLQAGCVVDPVISPERVLHQLIAYAQTESELLTGQRMAFWREVINGTVGAHNFRAAVEKLRSDCMAMFGMNLGSGQGILGQLGGLIGPGGNMAQLLAGLGEEGRGISALLGGATSAGTASSSGLPSVLTSDQASLSALLGGLGAQTGTSTGSQSQGGFGGQNPFSGGSLGGPNPFSGGLLGGPNPFSGGSLGGPNPFGGGLLGGPNPFGGAIPPLNPFSGSNPFGGVGQNPTLGISGLGSQTPFGGQGTNPFGLSGSSGTPGLLGGQGFTPPGVNPFGANPFGGSAGLFGNQGGCPFSSYTVGDLPPLKGSFEGCCARNYCYYPRYRILRQYSGVAAYWGVWGAWSECSASCGPSGRQRRQRECVQPEFERGKSDGEREACETGYDQVGSSMEKVCNRNPCPYWGPWSSWGVCSVSCGTGVSVRTRVCAGGTGCAGAGRESQPCSMPACPVFGEWSVWTGCNSDCGTGQRTRLRACVSGCSSVADENLRDTDTCYTINGVENLARGPCRRCYRQVAATCVKADGSAGCCGMDFSLLPRNEFCSDDDMCSWCRHQPSNQFCRNMFGNVQL